MSVREPTRRHDQSDIRLAGEGRDDPLVFGSAIAHVERIDLHPERRCHGLDGTKLAGAGGLSGITKDAHARHAWHYLLEQFQALPADAEFEKHETGGVAARPGKAVDET